MSKLSATLSIFGPFLFLSISSVLIIRSVAPEIFLSQLIFFLLSSILIVVIGKLDYQLYVFSPWGWYWISVVVLLFTLLFGSIIRGSSRWISIFGFSLQTSEFIKPLLIIFVASYLSSRLPTSITKLLKFLFYMLIPVLLIFLQPDLGSAILIMIITAASIISAGVGLKRIFITSFILGITLPLGYTQLKPYQRQRLESFIDPSADPLGSGYNAMQAAIAVGSGKFFGRGLGQGTQSHLRFLPERQSDFIFASLVEEFGFIGGAIIILSYLWLATTLIKAARYASSEMGSIICLTTLTLIITQATVNIGMNMGLLPITGITLPLVSSGGSSIASFAILIGICYSISLRPSGKKATLEIN